MLSGVVCVVNTYQSRVHHQRLFASSWPWKGLSLGARAGGLTRETRRSDDSRSGRAHSQSCCTPDPDRPSIDVRDVLMGRAPTMVDQSGMKVAMVGAQRRLVRNKVCLFKVAQGVAGHAWPAGSTCTGIFSWRRRARKGGHIRKCSQWPDHRLGAAFRTKTPSATSRAPITCPVPRG